MACPAQSMLSASGCIFLRSKPQVVRGGAIIGGFSSSKQFPLACNASSSPSPSSPSPAPPQEDPDCNEVECAPDKEVRTASATGYFPFQLVFSFAYLGHQNRVAAAMDEMVGSLSAEWLAEERTRVVGTFPPRKRGWTGLVAKDTAGQTNIYSVEPTVYVAESAISSGAAGTSAEGAENTAAIAGGLVLITVAAASSILIQVNKSQPQVPPEAVYNGPPLSYYVAKFQPEVAPPPPPAETLEAPAPAEAVVAAQEDTAAVEASAAAPEAEPLSSDASASFRPFSPLPPRVIARKAQYTD
ncbi:hypothetical protein HU200_038825 [Digitaria exilis]|uniref:Uncharacterized protein n=1 Tax=Digitaria exilis TaxID=1010633 RepID=A0A835BBB0_9POAL|nr:hypothetical protein HU200_038825 [Digitaria exilis]